MGHVWLIGMMGSGKTSVGRVLADRLALPFYDTDATASANAGMPIVEIFERFGEQRFRDLESRAVQAIAPQENGVVSTGGGVVLDPSNVEAMRDSGTTVLLEVDAATLVARIAGTTDRPLVSVDPERYVREIASARDEIYRRAADVVIDAAGSVDEVAHRVEAACSGS
ncbi:MAG: shikimate kinase [Actinomycetota bacterium]|nr:shikimate kinase [Actinomycetota bacterium]